MDTDKEEIFKNMNQYTINDSAVNQSLFMETTNYGNSKDGNQKKAAKTKETIYTHGNSDELIDNTNQKSIDLNDNLRNIKLKPINEKTNKDKQLTNEIIKDPQGDHEKTKKIEEQNKKSREILKNIYEKDLEEITDKYDKHMIKYSAVEKINNKKNKLQLTKKQMTKTLQTVNLMIINGKKGK